MNTASTCTTCMVHIMVPYIPVEKREQLLYEVCSTGSTISATQTGECSSHWFLMYVFSLGHVVTCHRRYLLLKRCGVLALPQKSCPGRSHLTVSSSRGGPGRGVGPMVHNMYVACRLVCSQFASIGTNIKPDVCTMVPYRLRVPAYSEYTGSIAYVQWGGGGRVPALFGEDMVVLHTLHTGPYVNTLWDWDSRRARSRLFPVNL